MDGEKIDGVVTERIAQKENVGSDILESYLYALLYAFIFLNVSRTANSVGVGIFREWKC